MFLGISKACVFVFSANYTKDSRPTGLPVPPGGAPAGNGGPPMEVSMMFVDCPAYIDNGAVRCGLPAEVEGPYTMRSTDGPLQSARIRCPRRHWFNGPVDSLTLAQQSRSCDGGQVSLPDHVDHGGPGAGSWRAPAS